MNTVEKYRHYVNTSALAGVEPITIESARGATVTATDGTEYTDLYSGIGVVNAGHVHPRVAEAAKRQIDRVDSLMLLRLPRPRRRGSRRAPRGDQPRASAEDLLRQQRRGGGRGGAAARTRLHGPSRGHRAAGLVPRTHRRIPRGHR